MTQILYESSLTLIVVQYYKIVRSSNDGSGEKKSDDDGSGEKKSDDGSGDGKKSDDGSSNNDDDDYTPNDDPQSTWFKVFKLLATRLLYIGVKRSCERSVKRKWKFLKFINISQAKKLQLLAKAKGKLQLLVHLPR
ncbi:unnamed protein product [Arabidopsis thaliana]|uniref:Uncharacterized protein n=1 Tax=Arabidopsis thaliana TaxID=3702 RepID=A0A5S9XYM2_ARATH|nr:unnamed protein product [Arabidopsis thaliana]